MKMLIVDDSKIIRQKIKRSHGMKEIRVVGTAANGQEAVQIAQKTKPEVITMDLTMPKMDGLECIRELVVIIPDALILVISALADKSTAIEALKLGAHGFLCKPFTDAELSEAIEQLVLETPNG